MTTNTAHTGTTHYLTWGTSSSYACGADAIGRRNTRTDLDPSQTTCPQCQEVIRTLKGSD